MMKHLGLMASRLGVLFMRLIAPLPLPMVRAMGWVLGWLVYALVWPRRRIVRKNLLLCFSEHSAQYLRGLEPNIFIFFAQTWLDRSWLWHGSDQQRSQRLQLTGDVASFAQNPTPCVLFAPHFMGLDAGWTALNSQLNPTRILTTIYAEQKNAVVNAWIEQGRRAQGQARLFARREGLREIAQSIKRAEPLYLLPDMDLGAAHSLFVPFFGVNTATVPSLHRFAKLGSAQVRSIQTLLTPQGYRIDISPPWPDFPSDDMHADTARMNRELETMIAQAPAQYYWVHKRFKTRPTGEASVY
jgi:Kdo2-lipid IVA lauroyltransferase/acyltransferase